ncbi:MAG: helix-turn-helix transcriptional regulator [Pyrinomonadaceae bacterium]
MLNNRKRRSTHPGEILREDVLPAAGLTQGELARLQGVSRRSVSEILHQCKPVTTDRLLPEMTVLAKNSTQGMIVEVSGAGC